MNKILFCVAGLTAPPRFYVAALAAPPRQPHQPPQPRPMLVIMDLLGLEAQ